MPAPAAAELVTDCLDTPEALERLRDEWAALFRRCPEATPFASPAWALPWWRSFAPGHLCTLAVRRGGVLVALAPAYVEEGPLGRRLLPIGIGISDYLDVLIDPDAPGAAAGLAAALEGVSGRFGSCEFEELAPGSAALRVPCPPGWSENTAEQSACPVLVRPAGAEALQLTLPPKKRRDLKLARNRAQRRGLEILAADEGTAEAFLADLFRLHGARWQSRGTSGVLADEEVRRFHALAVPALLAEGLARLYEVRIAGRPAAVYYGFQHRDRAYAYLTGIDPSSAFESPGTLVVAHAIEQAWREGAGEFHFLRGREPYKYQWGAVDRWNRRRSLRPPGRSDG